MLEDLCRKLLAKKKEDRPATGAEVAGEIEAFLEGAKERERRRAEADWLCERARRPVAALPRGGGGARAAARRGARAARGDRGPRADRAQAAGLGARGPRRRARARAGARAGRGGRALLAGAGPRPRQPRGARRARRPLLVARPPGRGRAPSRPASSTSRWSWSSTTAATPRCSPPAPGSRSAPARRAPTSSPTSTASATAILVPEGERYLGRTPLVEAELAPGSYLILLRRAGCRDTRYPVRLLRGEHHEAEVNLFGEDEIGRGFVHVPGGLHRDRRRREAFDSLPRQEVAVGDFAMARFPVTFDDYMEFINQLGDEEAVRRAPRDLASNLMLARRADRWVVRADLVVEGEAAASARRSRSGAVAAMAMSWFDAAAYCRWRSRRDGVVLPAADRGGVGEGGARRRQAGLPLGRPVRSHLLQDEGEPARPAPAGAGRGVSADESAYGILDLTGGMRTWAADVHGVVSVSEADAEPEPVGTSGRVKARVNRGGAWNIPMLRCRSAARFRNFATDSTATMGFAW